jgi:alkane 1-monooxygenase
MILLPLLDQATGLMDDGHFAEGEFGRVQLVLLAWSPRAYALLYMAAAAYITVSVDSFAASEVAILVGTMGLLGGIAFAAAHEMMHAKGRIDRIIEQVLTVFLFYPHYRIIHIHSHHRHAGTPEDQNTAWMNEGVYSYLFRSLPGSARRCREIEAKQQGAREEVVQWKRLLPSRMTLYAATQVLFAVAVYLAAGGRGIAFYGGQLVVAHIVFESVNYIQHYGLIRKREKGRYERIKAHHSWDAYHFFSSYATFRVGHHAHHHLDVVPYYRLDPEPTAPKLPVGYFWAIPAVLVPFVWRRVAHPRLPSNTRPSCREMSAATMESERFKSTDHRVL